MFKSSAALIAAPAPSSMPPASPWVSISPTHAISLDGEEMPKKPLILLSRFEQKPLTLFHSQLAAFPMPFQMPLMRFSADICHLGHTAGKALHNGRNDLRHRLYDLHDDFRKVGDQGHKKLYAGQDDLIDVPDKGVYDACDDLWDRSHNGGNDGGQVLDQGNQQVYPASMIWGYCQGSPSPAHL